MTENVSAERLGTSVASIFLALGSEEREARGIARQLVRANLLGHDSHGVGLVSSYVRMVREGKVVPNTRPAVLSRSEPILVMDGRRGFGATVMCEACASAIEVARSNGAAVLALRNAHHIGRVGEWAEQCADVGLVSIFFVNVIGVRPAVAPWGGSDARLLTNPFCVGVPDPERGHLILDFATSRVAIGKVRVALAKGEETPEGWLIGPDRSPTRDPSVLYTPPLGALLPFGEHKGYGLALVMEILAGALTGGGGMNAERAGWDLPLNNTLALVIDPDRLGAALEWRAEMARILEWVTASPPTPGSAAVLVPGDPERRSAESRRLGIPIEAATLTELRRLALELGADEP